MILSRRLLLYISSRDGGRPDFFFFADHVFTRATKIDRSKAEKEGRGEEGDRSIDRSEILDRRGRPGGSTADHG